MIRTMLTRRIWKLKFYEKWLIVVLENNILPSVLGSWSAPGDGVGMTHDGELDVLHDGKAAQEN